jgi:hypothetical protein
LPRVRRQNLCSPWSFRSMGVRMSASERRWHVSSYSGNGNCVEVCKELDLIRVRDSKDRLGAVLSFTHREWDAFLRGVRDGEFDIPIMQEQ